MRILSVKEEDFCTYAGIAGSLVTSAAILQHFYIYRVFHHPLPATMLVFFVFSLLSFIALARQQYFAPLLLIISSACCLLNAAMALGGPVFSLLALIQFVLAATVTIIIQVDGLPARLRKRRLAVIAEEHEWAGKI